MFFKTKKNKKSKKKKKKIDNRLNSAISQKSVRYRLKANFISVILFFSFLFNFGRRIKEW